VGLWAEDLKLNGGGAFVCDTPTTNAIDQTACQWSKEGSEEDDEDNHDVGGGIEQEQVSHNIRVSWFCVFAGNGCALACLLFTCGNMGLVGNWFDGCVDTVYKYWCMKVSFGGVA
jgi:hypothetical protein